MMRARLALGLALAAVPVAASHAQQCASAGQFKGLELYSWPAGGTWMLAMVPGTNRAKATAEIKSHPCAGTVEQMTGPLARLAPGQQLFWFHRRIPGFEYPPDNVIERVVAVAKRAGVELHGPPREDEVRAAPDRFPCRERASTLDERRGALALAQEEADRETAELQRRTGALDAERRAVDGSLDRALVAEYNARAARHRARVEAHNGRIGALNAEVGAVNSAIVALQEECGGGLNVKPP